MIGFDDIQIASHISPTLTTINQPAYEMGSLGAAILFDRIQSGRSAKTSEPVHRMLDFKLVVRESTTGHDGRG